MNDNEYPLGQWKKCDEFEIHAKNNIPNQLFPFLEPLEDCYEAGLQSAVLYAKRHNQLDMQRAAIFLKRTLTDLRGVWLLLSLGYTSQAASIAAALFENSLAVHVLAGSIDNLQELDRAEGDERDFPWGAKKLSQLVAQQHQKEFLAKNEPFTQEDYERAWKEVYSDYEFLCLFKHPTLKSAYHDAINTSWKGVFAVMVVPDGRVEDLSLKVKILFISIKRTYHAIQKFAQEADCDLNHPYYEVFSNRMKKVENKLLQAYRRYAKLPLPFSI